MNTHTLITKCKHLLIFKYRAGYTKPNPDKKEVVAIIKECCLTDSCFKDFSDNSILQTFYTLETGIPVDITTSNKSTIPLIKKDKKKRSIPEDIGEGSCVSPSQQSRKTAIFSRYINPDNIDLSTLPF